MHAFFLKPLMAAALGLSLLGTAYAAEYTSLNTADSRISFGYSQMNVNMDGSFRELKATQFSFDPAKPEAARVTVEIPLVSVDAGYSEANAEIQKGEWLDIAKHPFAQFQSSKVEALGDNRYQVTGQLSIKGKAQEVSAPFTFKEQGGSGVFDGAFTFKRADFGIGEGMWGDFGIVANDIQIKFHVIANS